MTETLLPQFANFIKTAEPTILAEPQRSAELLLERFEAGRKSLKIVYSPFDHINADARLVIVGMTPGKQQATNALVAAQRALRGGARLAEAAEKAKVFASFSGPMRSNLVALLDDIGVNKTLGVSTTASLWNSDSRLVHFTSALRYPVFVDEANWAGQPDMVSTVALRRWLESYTGRELASFPHALIVPLGPKVTSALRYLADAGFITHDQILDGLPHPSGANAERISYFLGRKPRHLLSTKTSPDVLDAARARLRQKVEAASAMGTNSEAM